MKKMSKRWLAVVLTMVMVLTLLAGCNQTGSNSTTEAPDKGTTAGSTEGGEKTTESGDDATTAGVINKDDLPTLSLFYLNASVPGGVVEGFRGDYFAEHGFNLEVWAHSPEKLTAIVNTGDLPDIMVLAKGENLNALIENGNIINFDDYLDKLPNLYAYENADQLKNAITINRNLASNGTGGFYGIPLETGYANTTVGFSKAGTSMFTLKWDVYEKIGAPEVKDEWDLIDVMEQMLKAEPTHPDGSKMYGTILDNGDDATYWGCAYTWLAYHGYHYRTLPFMGELNIIDDEVNYILTKDSLYYEGLKWYNEIYRRGLMDPDSINTDRGTQAKKIDAGYAMMPAGTLPGYQPIYYPIYLEGSRCYASQVNTASANVLVINSKTEHMDECLEFVNMWLNPDTYLELNFGTTGDMWYVDDSGATVLTDKFKDWLKAGNNYNGFKMSDGTEFSLFNMNMLFRSGTFTSYKDKDGNPLQANIAQWPEYYAVTSSGGNEILEKWQNTTGYESWNDLMEEKKNFYGDTPYDYYKGYLSGGPTDDAMKLMQSSLRDILVNGSWQCVYAESEAEFDAIWDKMVADAEAGGAKDLFQWVVDDYANARKLAGK